MNARKLNNMMATYTGFKGYQTVAAVKSQIPDELASRLTGKEIGMVMNAVNAAYHNGRASLKGVDVIDGDCLWIPWGGIDGIGQLIPIATLKRLNVAAMATEGE